MYYICVGSIKYRYFEAKSGGVRRRRADFVAALVFTPPLPLPLRRPPLLLLSKYIASYLIEATNTTL